MANYGSDIGTARPGVGSDHGRGIVGLAGSTGAWQYGQRIERGRPHFYVCAR